MKKKLPLILLSLFFAIVIWAAITLSNEYSSSILFPLKIINLPLGYTASSDFPPEIKIRIKGKGWKLLGVGVFGENIFVASVNGDSGKVLLKLSNFVAENTWLSNGFEVLDITPNEINFRVEKLFSTKIPVLPIARTSFRDGFGLASPIESDPDSVLVSGPYYVLKSIYHVETNPVNITSLDAPKTQMVSLKKIQGLDIEPLEVNLKINVQRIVANQFISIPVIVVNEPKGTKVLLEPNTIDVEIKGGIRVLGVLKTTGFKVYAEFKTIAQDTTGMITPTIILPPNIELLEIKPKQLKYIIQKF